MLFVLRDNISDLLEATVFKGVTSGGQRGLQVSLGSPLNWPLHQKAHEMGWPGRRATVSLREPFLQVF